MCSFLTAAPTGTTCGVPGSDVFLPHSVTTLRAPLTTDAKGNQIRDWPNATIGGPWAAFVQPAQSSEELINQDRVISRWKLFTAPAADILPTDRVIWSGLTFFVDGEVQAWDVGGGTHHHEGFLRRVVGG